MAQADAKKRGGVRHAWDSLLENLRLLQLIQCSGEGFRAAGHVIELADFLAFAIQDDDRRVTLDFVFLLQSLVCRFQFSGLFFLVGKIDFDEDEVFLGVFSKLRRAENFLVQFDAPAAPIRAGEIKHYEFLFRLGLGLRLGQIGQPGFGGVELEHGEAG